MFSLNRKLTTLCLVLLALATLVVQQAICDSFQPNNGPFSTATPKGGNSTIAAESTSAVKTPPAPAPATTASPSASVPLLLPPPPAASLGQTTTTKPVANAHPTSSSTFPGTSAAPAAAAAPALTPEVRNTTPGEKLAQYFEPICNNMDKLLPEHFFKVQFQLKQFIEKTAGKLSVCFMQHYMIDPNLNPLDKSQLNNICSSQNLAADAKGSFKSFQTCAEQNWDKSLDQELDLIFRKRSNCFLNHGHSKNDSTISLLHESDDFSLIGEVVGKVLLEDTKSNSVVNANITMINVGLAPGSSTLAPALARAPAADAKPVAANNTARPSAAGEPSKGKKKFSNDPNTVLVFVDDSVSTTSAPSNVASAGIATPAPSAALSKQTSGISTKAPVTPIGSSTVSSGAVIKTTQKPAANFITPAPPLSTKRPDGVVAQITAAPATSAKPNLSSLGDKILNAATSSAPTAPAMSTTAAPTVSTTSAKPAATSKPANATHLPNVSASQTNKPTVTSTMKPITPLTTSTALPTAPKPAGVMAPITTTKNPSTTAKSAASTTKPVATTNKPQTTQAAATSAKPATSGKPTTVSPQSQDKEKYENKSKLKKLKKEQDEKDVKNAIKALQIQRAGHAADARLHQIEHERQMAIDPVGHTLKHQRYEQMKKQQRTSTKSPESVADKNSLVEASA